jgi:ABC-type amino acid transport substrate-binding protein
MGCLGTIAAIGLSLTLAANTPVVIGTEAPFAPYTLLDEAGQITGFERDIADVVCDRAQLDCEWQNAQFDQLIPGVMTGRFDIVLGGMAVTPDRMRLVDFSLPYERSQESHSLFGFPGAPAPEAARIGVQSGTIHDTHARSKGWNVQAFDTGPDVIAALKAGRVDLAFGALTYEIEAVDDVAALYAEDIPDLGTAMAVCRGNDDLLAKINAALEAMQADGTIDEITARWL